MSMIEVKIGGLVPDKRSGSHILLLKIPRSSRYLPIWIGTAEATSIAIVLRQQSFERPLTHDLLQHVIEGLGATVSRVVVTAIQEGTFYARIFLERDSEVFSVDARPSDSIALAVRVGCPVYVTEELLASQVEHLLEIEEASAGELPSGESEESELSVSEEDLAELMRRVEKGLDSPPGLQEKRGQGGAGDDPQDRREPGEAGPEEDPGDETDDPEDPDDED